MIELTLEMAEKVVEAAQAKAHVLGIPITVAVVDEAGRLILCSRGDGTGFLTPDTSKAKAVAAAAFRRATKDIAANAPAGFSFWSAVPSVMQEGVLPTVGGVPIMKEGNVIGAIGCGGGTGEQDHECAVAGAAFAVENK